MAVCWTLTPDLCRFESYWGYMKKEDFKYVKQIPGIYRIVNKKTGHSFVGRTMKLKKALIAHLDNVESKRYSNVSMYDEMMQDGLDSFNFEILSALWAFPGKEWLNDTLDMQLHMFSRMFNAEVIDLS